MRIFDILPVAKLYKNVMYIESITKTEKLWYAKISQHFYTVKNLEQIYIQGSEDSFFVCLILLSYFYKL